MSNNYTRIRIHYAVYHLNLNTFGIVLVMLMIRNELAYVTRCISYVSGET